MDSFKSVVQDTVGKKKVHSRSHNYIPVEQMFL